MHGSKRAQEDREKEESVYDLASPMTAHVKHRQIMGEFLAE